MADEKLMPYNPMHPKADALIRAGLMRPPRAPRVADDGKGKEPAKA